MRRWSEDGRFCVADTQQEHLRADLARALQTPLYLPDSPQYHYGNRRRHSTTSIPSSLSSHLSGQPLAPQTTSASQQPGHLRHDPAAPSSSPVLLRKALASVCLQPSRGQFRRRNSENLHVTFADERTAAREHQLSGFYPPSSRSFEQSGLWKAKADSFGEIPEEEEEWFYATKIMETALPASQYFTTPHKPAIGVAHHARLLSGENDVRRASDGDVTIFKKDTLPGQEDEAIGGMVEKLMELDRRIQTMVPTAVCPALLHHFGHDCSYATYPASRTYLGSAAGNLPVLPDAFSQAEQLGNVPDSDADTKEKLSYGYATFPPMNPSAHGWTKTFPKQRVASLSSPKSSSQGILKRQSFSCSSLSRLSEITSDFSVTPTGRELQSDLCNYCSSAEVRQCHQCPTKSATRSVENGKEVHGSLSFSSVTDFMLQRYLDEVGRVFQLYPKLSPSSSSQPIITEQLSNLSQEPFSSSRLPAEMRGRTVRFAPLGRFLMDMLSNSSGDTTRASFGQGSPENQAVGEFKSRLKAFAYAPTSEDSWRALTDMVKFQTRFFNGNTHSFGFLPKSQLQRAQSASISSGYSTGDSDFLQREEIDWLGSSEGSQNPDKGIGDPQTVNFYLGLENGKVTADGDNEDHKELGCGSDYELQSPASPEEAQSDHGHKQHVSSVSDRTNQQERPRSLSQGELSLSNKPQPLSQRSHSLCQELQSLCRENSTEPFQQLGDDAHIQTNPETGGIESQSFQPIIKDQLEQCNSVKQDGQPNQGADLQEVLPSENSSEEGRVSVEPEVTMSESKDQRTRSQESRSEDPKNMLHVPLKIGSSDEMAADFLLFCSAVQCAIFPPSISGKDTADTQLTDEVQHPPRLEDLSPFPDFCPDWFRSLPGFPS